MLYSVSIDLMTEGTTMIGVPCRFRPEPLSLRRRFALCLLLLEACGRLLEEELREEPRFEEPACALA